MAERYSAIVVGGGHNGLVAANYLARKGNRVLVLERCSFVGGACITEELFPGFRVSSCAYICHLLQAKVIDALPNVSSITAVYIQRQLRLSSYLTPTYIRISSST